MPLPLPLPAPVFANRYSTPWLPCQQTTTSGPPLSSELESVVVTQRVASRGSLREDTEADVPVILERIVQPGIVTPHRAHNQPFKVRIYRRSRQAEREALAEVVRCLVAKEGKAVELGVCSVSTLPRSPKGILQNEVVSASRSGTNLSASIRPWLYISYYPSQRVLEHATAEWRSHLDLWRAEDRVANNKTY